MRSIRINRRAFIASAAKSFFLIVAPFQLAALGVMFAGSESYPWWIISMPGIVSLLIGIAIIFAMPRVAIGWLAMNFGLACTVGMMVIALSAGSYFVTADQLSVLPSTLSRLAKFVGVVCAFSMPFGSLYGLFLYGAATRNGDDIDGSSVGR